MSQNRQELLTRDAECYAVERLRVAHLNYPPRWVTIGISSMCTNHCTFCSYHSLDARDGGSNVYGLKYVMPLVRFKSQVDFFHAGRVPHVHICAPGEPFLHPDIMAMIDHVIARYGKASFQSTFNRVVMARGDYLSKILDRRVQISYIVTDIQAGEATGHEAIKRGSSFADLLTTLQILSDAGIRIIGNFIITRENHTNLPGLINTLYKHGIRLRLNVENLFPHMFNEFTAMENVYHLGDWDIAASLQEARELAKATRESIELTLPTPFGDPVARCSVFWDKIQIWPVKGVDAARYDENLVPHACNAVVLGDMNSLGYVSDYPDVMALWNNPTLVALRIKILAGEAPDKFCWSCPCGVALKGSGPDKVVGTAF